MPFRSKAVKSLQDLSLEAVKAHDNAIVQLDRQICWYCQQELIRSGSNNRPTRLNSRAGSEGRWVDVVRNIDSVQTIVRFGVCNYHAELHTSELRSKILD